MERYLDVDIALDTYPYPGGGTTCDALFMGVPVVTRYGDRHSTRFSYSLLQNIGAGELAVETSREYIEKAVALAHNEALLDDYHKNLRSRMQNTSVADPKQYMEEVEAQYHEIWNRYLAQNG